MKNCLIILAVCLLSRSLSAQTNAVLDRQHVDIRLSYNANATNKLSVHIRNADSQATYETNAALLVVGETAKYPELPAGTPFGDEGEPLWILPQSQDPQLLYLGLSAAGINNGIFNGNTVSFELLSIKAPSHFFAWQTDEFGGFLVKMNTRDGIAARDKTTPIVGSHEHLNWGFSTNGVYCLTFRASGVRTGESTNTTSLPSTIQFNVLPLRPFELWQSNHWQFATADIVINPSADPDGDGISNVFEYAFGSEPTNSNSGTPPRGLIINTGGSNYGAVRFSRAKSRPDITYSLAAADSITGPWLPITPISTIQDNGTSETVTMRDTAPVAGRTQRFLRLRIQLIGPPNYGCGCF